MDMKHEKMGYSILGIAILIVVVVFSSLAIFTYSKKGTTANKITSGTVTMSYLESEAGISITNAYPITDAEGKVLSQEDVTKGVNSGYFDFQVSATMSSPTTIQYIIYGKNISSAPSLEEQYVKVYLTDGAATETAYTGYQNTVPSFGSLSTLEGDNTSRILYTGNLTKTSSSQSFRLRMWVSSTYQDATVARNFTLKIGVKATQVAQ